MITKDVGEIEKTDNVKTVIRLTDFKGRNLLDVRDFFKPKGSSMYSPTKKGICLDVSKVSTLINLLEQAEATLNGTTQP